MDFEGTMTSVVRLYGNRPTTCGYCAAKKESHQYVIEAVSLSIEDYQALLDRGWRRSGMHLYQPDRQNICCVPYTIRLNTSLFVPTKADKRVLRKLEMYLVQGEKKRKRNEEESQDARPLKKIVIADSRCEDIKELLKNTIWTYITPLLEDMNQAKEALDGKICVLREKSTKVKLERGNYTSPSAHVVCAYLKKHGTNQSIDVNTVAEDLCRLIELPQDLTITATKGFLNVFDMTATSETTPIEPIKVDAKPQEETQQKKEWRLETIRPTNTPEIYEIYKAYQEHVHNDKAVTPASFESFLVATPLPAKPGSTQGSFFQLYRLEDELIAVGVIDILGKNWSSVYFFYKPEYSNLQLGTYSALREIARCNGGYYYMGYYIANCIKMQYKARFSPSELLCPRTLQYVALTKQIQALVDADASKVVQLNAEEILQEQGDIDGIILHYPQGTVRVKDARSSLHPAILSHLEDFVKLVGPDLSHRLRVQMF